MHKYRNTTCLFTIAHRYILGLTTGYQITNLKVHLQKKLDSPFVNNHSLLVQSVVLSLFSSCLRYHITMVSGMQKTDLVGGPSTHPAPSPIGFPERQSISLCCRGVTWGRALHGHCSHSDRCGFLPRSPSQRETSLMGGQDLRAFVALGYGR